MRRASSGLLVGLLLSSILAADALASPVSPRLRRVMEAWQAASSGKEPVLAPYLADALDAPLVAGSAAPGSAPSVRLLVTIQDPGVLRARGFDTGTIAGDVATVRVPLSRLEELVSLPGLVHAEVSLPVKLLLDASTADIGSNMVNGSEMPPYSGYTGSGVVVGFVDSGIDFSHEDFKLDGGESRIACIWDQNDAVGPRPMGYPYGTVWKQADITAGTPRQRDTVGHGTHISGIAAGNGRASDSESDVFLFVGVAPEATIAMVNTDFSEAGLVEGAAWIQDLATDMGYPSVVNMSLGNQFGPHDGTGSLDRAVGNLSGAGKILVAAAGNERGDRIHAEASLTGGANVSIQFSVGSYAAVPGLNNEIVSIEGWYEGNQNLRFTVTTPRNVTVGPVSPLTPVVGEGTVDGRVDLMHGTYDINMDKFVYVDVYDQSAAIRQGVWTIAVENLSGSMPAAIDFWIVGVDVGQGPGATVQWVNFVEEAEVINSPSASPDVISAGAHVTKRVWDSKDGSTYEFTDPSPLGGLASFSSPGPLRNGTLKPDFTAPGFGIASAKSANAPAGSSFNVPQLTTPDCFHLMATGTSMATPHISGAAALLLEVDPTLTNSEIRDLFGQSAREDLFTGDVPNNDFGRGKLDVKGALDILMTPVKLFSIAAGWEEGKAVLRWRLVETEPGSLFRIDRGPTPHGPFTDVGTLVSSEVALAWTDTSPDANAPWYRVSVTARDGSQERFGPVRLEPQNGAVRLFQNAPNPFSKSTRVAFEVALPQPVSLEVLDASGRLVTTLARAVFEPGRHEIDWDGSDRSGSQTAAGVYFLRLSTNGSVEVRRLQRVL